VNLYKIVGNVKERDGTFKKKKKKKKNRKREREMRREWNWVALASWR
jgi:hypothetical protein